MGKHICLYCDYWISSHVIKRDLLKKVKGESLKKRCKITKKKITFNTPSCEYFKPAKTIYCDKNNERINMLLCLNRRLNRENFTFWNGCKKCRQFEYNIQPVIEDYHFNLRKVIEKSNLDEKEDKRKFKRRNQEYNKKRKLKRRKSTKESTPTAKKSLKRRKSKIKNSENKRKLRRRK